MEIGWISVWCKAIMDAEANVASPMVARQYLGNADNAINQLQRLGYDVSNLERKVREVRAQLEEAVNATA